MKPFKLKPAYKDYIWGGRALIDDFNKRPAGSTLAESWEISAHPEGQSTICTGEHEGMGFGDYCAAFLQAIGGGDFPVLIKLIDAAQALSIQVHPDDAYARRVEGGSGKTELWYVLDSRPGAYIYFGFKEAMNRARMERSIADGSITSLLRKVEAKKGDVFFIPAGTIHSIGAGLVIAEVQQSSNATYRVYDFGRLDALGQPRELHIQKALEVTSMQPAQLSAPGTGLLGQSREHALERLAGCNYFTVDRLRLDGSFLGGSKGFVGVLCTEGSAVLDCAGEALDLRKGDSAFIPAGNDGYRFEGRAELLLCS